MLRKSTGPVADSEASAQGRLTCTIHTTQDTREVKVAIGIVAREIRRNIIKAEGTPRVQTSAKAK